MALRSCIRSVLASRIIMAMLNVVAMAARRRASSRAADIRESSGSKCSRLGRCVWHIVLNGFFLNFQQMNLLIGYLVLNPLETSTREFNSSFVSHLQISSMDFARRNFLDTCANSIHIFIMNCSMNLGLIQNSCCLLSLMDSSQVTVRICFVMTLT